MKTKFATLTIGQAPRSDIVPAIEEVLPHGVACIHAGVLDGMSAEEVRRGFAPMPGSEQLVSRLNTGEAVVLDHEAIRRGLQAKLKELCDLGCGVILILCTGKFEGLAANGAILLEPDHVLPPLVRAIVGTSRVGIIVPLASQIQAGAQKWCSLEQPIVAACSPYDKDEGSLALVRTAQQLREKGAQTIVLDCMGFTRSHQRAVIQGTELRVVLPSAMMARIAVELLTPQLES